MNTVNQNNASYFELLEQLAAETIIPRSVWEEEKEDGE